MACERRVVCGLACKSKKPKMLRLVATAAGSGSQAQDGLRKLARALAMFASPSHTQETASELVTSSLRVSSAQEASTSPRCQQEQQNGRSTLGMRRFSTIANEYVSDGG